MLFALAAILAATGSVAVLAQQSTGRAIVFPSSIQWNRQKSVTWYRLQIASDERFQDVVFDRRGTGNRYLVNDLAPGYYYWRVAPANSQVGDFSRPQRMFVSGGVVTTVRRPNRTLSTR
jgi:hypothetical protein